MSRSEFELLEIYSGDFIRNLRFFQSQSRDQYRAQEGIVNVPSLRAKLTTQQQGSILQTLDNKEQTMRNIKEIRAEMAKLREEYEARIALLKAEIESVRARRGYVPKPKAGSDEPYYEPGRSQMPGYYYAEGGSMCNGLGRSYF